MFGCQRKGSEQMKHTMRSAFKRWLILHNEEWRNTGYVRIPNWFRHYIRQHTDWSYTVTHEQSAYYCNKCELNYDALRRYKGHYTFDISDEELLSLQRAEWIKDDVERQIKFVFDGGKIMEIKCPRCNRKAKLRDGVCSKQERKRVMIYFPCNHYACLVYNVPVSTDDNAIMKDFKSISQDYFEKTYYLSHFGDRYL